MSGSVSVPGPGGSTITQTFSNSFNSQLAQSISKALQDAQAAGTLTVTSATSSGLAPPPASGSPGDNELFVTLAPNGTVTVPAGYGYVVDNSTGPDTIFGSPGQQILVGPGQHTIIDPTSVVLSDSAFGVVTLTGVGDVVAAGNGAATVNAKGANESVLGGAGTLFANITGSASGDTVVGGPGAVFATVSGSFAVVQGGDGALAATVSGSGDTISGGGGKMSVLVTGSSDTINAGVSSTFVTTTGGSFVRGNSGPLNFVGGAGPSTIFDASGSSTVFGSEGFTSIVGAAGGVTTYVNTTSGGLTYVAGAGNETIDASLSKTGAWLQGGTGQNLLVGGAGADGLAAGSGAGTIVGGGGANVFYFFKAEGGPTAQDVISDFSAIDHVALVNYGAGEAVAAIAGATTSGGSTTITLSDNTKITFTGVTNVASIAGQIVSVS